MAAASAGAQLRKLLPSTSDYRGLRGSWSADVLAGITVGIVALPLALAFGISSGAGAAAGIVTAIVAGCIAAIFGGSNVQVSGPTGAMVVVLAPLVAEHGPAVLPLVCVAAGLLVMLAGVLQLGRVVSLIPWPVVEGFTLGIAIIIFAQQVPAALGVETPETHNAVLAAVFAATQAALPDAAAALLMALLVAVVMIVLPRFAPKIPASICGIVLATVVASMANLATPRIGALPSGLPAPTLPAIDPAVLGSLADPILAVAALAAIESLLSARVAATMGDTGDYDGDRELVGQGLASFAAGFFGGMPATGAIARTAVNVRSGARTRLAAIVHSALLLLVVLIGAQLVGQIPLATLAGVLLVTAVRMVSWPMVARMLRVSRSDAIVFVLTAAVTVSVDLIYAVAIGIAAAGLLALRSLSRASGVHREELPGPVVSGDDHIALFRIDGALFFGTAERLVERVTTTAGITVAILRMSHLQVFDATAARVLSSMITALDQRGVTVLLTGVREEHMSLATRTGMLTALRHPRHLFDDVDDAVEHARSHVRRAREAAG